MIRESAVLLRIQHFQQRAGRTSVEGCRQLVYLVQDHHRIGDAALMDTVHDPARHGTDVGAAVAPDIRLVMHSAETHPHIFPPQGAGDALPDAGLSGAGRSHEQKNGPGLLFFQVHHRDLLDHPLLYLFQSVMVLVQNAPRRPEVDVPRLLFFPGEGSHEIQVVIEHS